jgi:hypothetical protein
MPLTSVSKAVSYSNGCSDTSEPNQMSDSMKLEPILEVFLIELEVAFLSDRGCAFVPL